MYINKSATLAEVFENVAKKGTNEEKASLLKRYDTELLRWYIDALYNGEYSKLSLPEFKYSKVAPGVAFMRMKQAIPRLNSALKYVDNKRISERNLLLVLENISKEEAVLIEKLIRGEKRIDGVSKAVFKKAYPQFFQSTQTS
ncbi:MAG: hypothetical protein R3230_00435 [Nitrosopumilaceae archaeon]|nr:hypothetical protein [Nitrosopumilaceae archaeon]